MLNEKVRQLTFLYDTKSPDYRDQHMRANAWEGMGKEWKIKRKIYVSSRDVRTVCPRLTTHYGMLNVSSPFSVLWPLCTLNGVGLDSPKEVFSLSVVVIATTRKENVRYLTLRSLTLYIYMEHLFLMFLDHTQRRSTVGRTPLDE